MFIFLILSIAVNVNCYIHENNSISNLTSYSLHTNHLTRKASDRNDTTGDPPRTPMEMMARFNANFLKYLSSRSREEWTNLMEITDEKAYIETCMEPSYGLNMEQFQKWMLFLSNYYVEVGQTATTIIDSSDTDVTTELTYRTLDRSQKEGSDKWSMSATFNSEKGIFMIRTLHMLSDCTNIPKNQSLEPVIPLETFIADFRTKLVSDIFLDDALRYKSAYEQMYAYLTPNATISVCDLGKLTTTQFVEYWYKRFGKVKHYKDHFFNQVNDGQGGYAYFEVTFSGEKPDTLFRDKYRFKIVKYKNPDVRYFETSEDWAIVDVYQKCTEDRTPMSKSDAAEHKMALASRRWDQVFIGGFEWDTFQAFKELFDTKSFNGWRCGDNKFKDFQDFCNFIEQLRGFFKGSAPKQTKVYDYKDSKIGFEILTEMTGNEGAIQTHHIYFEGYYENDQWQLNHLGFSCPD